MKLGKESLLKTQRGFTLVELLVVLAILAVIAVLIIPNILGNLDVSRQKADQLTLATLNNAVYRYQAAEGIDPVHERELVDKKYLDQIPKAQQKNKSFSYSSGLRRFEIKE